MTTNLALTFAPQFWEVIVDETITSSVHFTSITGIFQIKLIPSSPINTTLGGKIIETIPHPDNYGLEINTQWIKTNTWTLYSPSQKFEIPTNYRFELNPRIPSGNLKIIQYTLALSDINDSLNERLVLIESNLGNGNTDYSQTLSDIQNNVAFIKDISFPQLEQKIDEVNGDIQSTLNYEISTLANRVDNIESTLNNIQINLDSINQNISNIYGLLG